MKVLVLIALMVLSSKNLYSAPPLCMNLFFAHYQKTTRIAETQSRHNLYGYTREWNTYHYTNGVKFHRMIIEGEVLNQTWSRDPSPYNRALEVLTAYFGRVKLKPKQDYFLFFEQGSKQLFQAYENFINRPLQEQEYLANSNRDNIANPVEVFKQAKNYGNPVTVKSKRKKAVPQHVRKHKITFYMSKEMIFVKVTDMYKTESAQNFYLTLVNPNSNVANFNQLIQVLYVFNGFKQSPDKPRTYYKKHKFDIARTHPLFHIQEIIKKQNSLLNKLIGKNTP
ncbi:MAG: hypothetical protein MK008_08470 [Bdellovibrionales bacterium]|nr:hypothetical protein [Bdellovibrionales bacterium]